MIAVHTPARAAVALSLVVALAAGQASAVDIRQGVPTDAYLLVYHMHNPERDYQQAHFADVWQTVEETQIIPKAIEIVTSRVPESNMEAVQGVMDELRAAAEPIDLEVLKDSQESVYAQQMPAPSGDTPAPPTSQHLGLVKMDPASALDYQQGILNLMQVAVKYADGMASVETSEAAGTTIHSLAFPGQIPYQPSVAVVDDVLVLSSSAALAAESIELLAGSGGKSKYDDPRLQEALADLPQPEDNLVFFDVKQQMDSLRQVTDFIQAVAGEQPEAERVVGLIDRVFDEIDILDYEVTVEYTDGNINRGVAAGRLLPGAESKTLAKLLDNDKTLEDWQSWVPKDAVSFSLTTGIDLHLAYEWIMGFVEDEVPEAQPGLEMFESLQDEFDVHLDRDILQSFPGEMVSVVLPGPPSMFGGATTQSVLALRCTQPERIEELLDRLTQAAVEHPAGKGQQLAVKPCESLDGFQQISMTSLQMFGAKPVFGFRDGWFFVATAPEAVQRVFEVRSGDAASIAESETFQQFGVEIDGPITSIKYVNVASNVRQAARIIGQLGMMAPMFLGMASEELGKEATKVLQEVAALLPSVGKIVSKFDFYQSRLVVGEPGEVPGTYVRETALIVREANSE